MNILTAFLLILGLSPQEVWRDTHRVTLRNGNALDGRVEMLGDREILLRWAPNAILRLKTMDVLKVEEITIRPLNTEPKKVPIPKPEAGTGTDPAPADPKDGPAPPPTSSSESAIGRLLTKLLSNPTMDWQAATKEILALGPEGAKAMIAELPAMDTQRTNLVLMTLDMMRDFKIETELRGLLSEKRADLRAAACSLLANRNASGVVRSLTPLLRDPAPSVRSAALLALAALGDATTLQSIADLSLDPDAGVRTRAIRHAEELSARLEADNDLAERWLQLAGRGPRGLLADFANSLGRLADRAKEEFPADRVRERLTDMLGDRDPVVRGSAAYALSKVKPGEPSAEVILAVLESEREPKAAVQMCEALGRLKILKAIDPLIERLSSDDRGVRDAAQRALEKIAGSKEYGSDAEKWKQWADLNRGKNP